MKKNIILGLTVAGLSFTAANALATSDDNRYPAANFEPKVVYVDKDVIQQTTSADPRFPAAHFQPKIIYIDKDAVALRKKREVIFDPEYPAAYFEPKVIYP